jgi:hypothetical protein
MYNEDNLEYYITCGKGSDLVGYVNFENNQYKVVKTPEEATVIKSKRNAEIVEQYLDYSIPKKDRKYHHYLLNIDKANTCIVYLISVIDEMSRYHKHMMLHLEYNGCGVSDIGVRTTINGAESFETINEAKKAIKALRLFWRKPTLCVVSADINSDDTQEVTYHYVDIGSAKITTNIPSDIIEKSIDEDIEF